MGSAARNWVQNWVGLVNNALFSTKIGFEWQFHFSQETFRFRWSYKASRRIVREQIVAAISHFTGFIITLRCGGYSGDTGKWPLFSAHWREKLFRIWRECLRLIFPHLLSRGTLTSARRLP